MNNSHTNDVLITLQPKIAGIFWHKATNLQSPHAVNLVAVKNIRN
jgi:hypothetical protein